MDKYGEFYGCEKISELLGLDQAALDFSSDRRGRKWLKRETALGALWVDELIKNMTKSLQFCKNATFSALCV